MTPRSDHPPLFYSATVSAESDRVELEGDEAKHVLQARRLSKDDVIVLTNGGGLIARERSPTLTRKPIDYPSK